MVDQKQSALLGLSFQELSSSMQDFGEPLFRGRQMFDAIYRQRLTSVDHISTLPQNLRDRLKSSGFEIGVPKIENRFESIDGTVRYLISFSDGQSVETVWMPEGDGGEAGDGTESGDEEA